MMEARHFLACLIFFAMSSYMAYATDPTQLQDFCVAVNNPYKEPFVNGLFCKNLMDATPEDFFLEGLDKPGNTNNMLGFSFTPASVLQLPGLHTLGITLVRFDYAPYGLNPPHTNPRASEILTVLEGTLYVGFVTSNLPNGENKLFAKVLNKGDVFVFPQGLIHFQFNAGKKPVVAIAMLSSQNPDKVTLLLMSCLGLSHLSLWMF
ncbi:germin-like protein [Chenopodium quinoa]|uniref:germin-like protein n=1 Tax=Chenopodium quinoa TaxID=63459 RepID=UPI000B76FD32|nr:germin-like protein [Chenopodium quinoa]